MFNKIRKNIAAVTAAVAAFSSAAFVNVPAAKAAETDTTLYVYYEGPESLYIDVWKWAGISVADGAEYAADPFGWGKDLAVLQPVDGMDYWYSVNLNVIDASAEEGLDVYAGSDSNNILKTDNTWGNTPDIYEKLVSGASEVYVKDWELYEPVTEEVGEPGNDSTEDTGNEEIGNDSTEDTGNEEIGNEEPESKDAEVVIPEVIATPSNADVSPKTGDNTGLAVLFAMLGLSGIGIVAVAKRRAE